VHAPVAAMCAAPEALTPAERTLIARWMAAQIVRWPPDNCFCCKRPIVYGAEWIATRSDNGVARFHADCLPSWRLHQEAAARRALGCP
jgi:hypothetical protein